VDLVDNAVGSVYRPLSNAKQVNAGCACRTHFVLLDIARRPLIGSLAMSTRRFTVLVLTGSLLVGSVLSACSGGAPAASEDGSRQVGPVTLTVPAGWVKVPKAASRNEDAAWVSAGGGSTPAQGITVVLSRAAGDVEIAFSVHSAATQTSFPGIRRGVQQDADVPGAAGARRVSWQLARSATAPGGSLYDLVAVTKGGTQVFVRVATREPAADVALAESVLGSVKVRS
jgi:hypothetical protein